MPLETLAEKTAEITALKASIAKAETAQGYSPGSGMTLTRGSLPAMYAQLALLKKEYRELEAGTGRSGGANFSNKVQFQRQR